MNTFLRGPASHRYSSRRALALVAGVIVLITAWMSRPAPSYAWGNCQNPYVVQRGDYLLAIAWRFNTTLGELLNYNPSLMYHPDLIFAGQVICLPPSAPLPMQLPAPFPMQAATPSPTQPPAPQTNSLDIVAEITYTYQPAESNPLTVGPQPDPPTSTRQLSKRVVYHVERGQNCEKEDPGKCDIVLGSAQLGDKLNVTPAPVLVAVQQRAPVSDTNHPAGSYYLVAIGDEGASLLKRLNFLDNDMTVTKDTGQGCNPTPLRQSFGPNVKEAAGNIVVEGENEYRHVFPLSDLDIVQDWKQFQKCYEIRKTLFALFPSKSGNQNEHRLLLLTTDPQNPGGNERYYNRYYYPQPSPWWFWGFRFWW